MIGRRLAGAVSLAVWLWLAIHPAAAQDGDAWSEARSSRLELAAFVAPYLTSGPAANVLIGVEARNADAAPSEGDTISLTLAIADSSSSRPLIERAVTVQAKSGGAAAAPPPLLIEIPMTSGRYELRLRETAASPAGAATPPLALVVPFDVRGPARPPEAPFAMSPLTLTSSTVGTPAAGDVSEERRLFPLLLRPPSPRRRFAQDERVEVFVEIYDWDSEPGFEQQFMVRTLLRDATGAMVHMTEEMGTAERLDSGLFGYAHSTLLPVATLPPGSYALEVAVESLLTAARVARRATIAVEPAAPR